MHRPIAALTVAAALWLTAPAAALTPQPFTDVTPPDSKLILCPAELGGGSGLAWLRFGETAGGRDILDLSAAGVDPPTPARELQFAGGCPRTATTAAGATLVALNRTGFSDEYGRVFAIDRAPGGATGPPIALNDSERAQSATPALASSGAALVAWTEIADFASIGEEDTRVLVAARDAGGAFQRLGVVAAPGKTRVPTLAAGVDDAGYGVLVWTEEVENDLHYSTRVMAATRAPGGAFTATRELGRWRGSIQTSLVVGRTGEVLVALASEDGVRVATGTTRTGLGAARQLGTANSSNVTAVLTAAGAAAVAWTEGRDEEASGDGVRVSDRPAGGDFGPPHALVAPRSRLAGNGIATANLRLAAAPDGRVLASWAVRVSAGDGAQGVIPVAALRRADGSWEAAVSMAGPCREPVDGFPGFDAAGQPRALLADSGFVNAGDFGFPVDTRVRLVRLGGVPATPAPPPKVTLTAARRQVLRNGAVRLRVRCSSACDAQVLAVIRGKAGAGSGLFPEYARLRPGRSTVFTPERASYFDNTGGALDAEGRTVKVRLVVHACDSAGRVARARRTVFVRVPRTRR